MEEDWDVAINGDEWTQSDAAGEKKVIAKMIQDSRSWGRKARCKIEEFRMEEIRHRARSRRGHMNEHATTEEAAGATRFEPERQQKAGVSCKEWGVPSNERNFLT